MFIKINGNETLIMYRQLGMYDIKINLDIYNS